MDSSNIDSIERNGITEYNDNKRIDNRILTSKEKINKIDERLDNAKRRIKNLSSMQDNVDSIAKSMNKCIDLLGKSLKGPHVSTKLSDMYNSNKLFLIYASAGIEEEKINVRRTINELYKEKDKILKEDRNEYNKNEEQVRKEQEEMKAAREKIFNQEETFEEEPIKTK